MSTYWYFECLDHDPPLVSDDEFTQHTDDTAFKRGVAMAQRRPLPTEDELFDQGLEPSGDYFDCNARRFLIGHPRCRLGLLNEYGEHLDLVAALDAPTPPTPPKEQT